MDESGKRTRRRRLLRAFAWTTVVAVLASGVFYRRTMPGALFLMRVADASHEAETAGDPLVEDEVVIQGDRPIPARVYRPVGGSDRTIVLLHGVHWGGYREARLIPFARKLAGMGFTVVTPDLADLRDYEIRARAVDEIERAIRWTLEESKLVPATGDGRVGVIGISFSGGLGLSAAGRPGVRDRIAFVLSFGGHADLDRTMEFLATSRLPDGRPFQAHVYGQVVLARQLAERLVPPEEVDLLRSEFLAYLRGEEAAVRERAPGLPPASRALVELALARDGVTMGRLLAPLVKGVRSPDSLSPVRGKAPTFPTFLLHGSTDDVIPASEALAVAEWAAPSGEVRLLVTDQIGHVDMESEGGLDWYEALRLAAFMTDLMRI